MITVRQYLATLNQLMCLCFFRLRSHKQPFAEIEQYIERISVPEDKYLFYMELKVYWKAVEVAAKLRSPEKLKEVSL